MVADSMRVGGCGSGMMGHKDVHVLISRTCEYV